jgi:NADH-quinone oxidoreductase subunit M
MGIEQVLNQSWWLTLLIFLPLAGILPIVALEGRSAARSRYVALLFSTATLVVAIVVVIIYARQSWNAAGWVLEQRLNILSLSEGGAGGAGFETSFHVAVDGVSLWLIVLSALLSPLAIWGSFSAIRENQKGYYSLMLLLESAVLGVFCARDLLMFYVFFDLTLVPLFLLIGIWGGADRRYAAYKFFVYTMTGSVLLLGGILYLAWRSWQIQHVFSFDFDRLYAVASELSWSEQRWLFLAMFAAFAIKVPLFPLHTWLPLAHTEAPTAGSVILAGLLLKLGTYGFLRFAVPLFPAATFAFAPVLAGLAITGILYTALVAWVQTDFKKLIAYSSVSHLGFCMLGLFSLKVAGVNGSLLYMVNHGLSTGALFLVIWMIYERYHTRDMRAVGGLARRMPRLAFFMVFFALASIALPGLNGFVSEFLVLLGTFLSNTGYDGYGPGPLDYRYAVVAAIGIILGAVYMFWWLRRVLFGPLVEPEHTPDTSNGLTLDINARETSILAILAAACLALGVYPKPLLTSMQPSLEAGVLKIVHSQQTAYVQRSETPAAVSLPAAVAVRMEQDRQ